jgi:hypothetical protein
VVAVVSLKVTREAVLGPMRMIRAASVCVASRTTCPLTEYRYSPTYMNIEWVEREGER